MAKSLPEFHYIGKHVAHKEDYRLLIGHGRYIDDIEMPGALHACFVRSPHAHARIVSIDASAAVASGALCVLTAKDLPFNERPWITRYWHAAIRNGLPRFLPPDRVRFVGEPVTEFVLVRAEDIGGDLHHLNVSFSLGRSELRRAHRAPA